VRYLILLVSFLFGADYIQIYKNQGKTALIERLDNILSSKNYWLDYLKDKNVSLGYYENKKYILFCNKSKKSLKLYDYDKNTLKLVDKFNVLVGLDGDKKKEGDLITPVGVYKLSSILKNLDDYYGPFAFETTYPNYLDSLQKKSGHGIWIHGMRNDRKKPTTKGCIAMKNNLLKRLKSEIDYKKTYLLITQNIPFFATKEEIANVLAFIYKWRAYWQRSDFENYISLYSKDFKKRGMNFKRFYKYKKMIFNKRKGQDIDIVFKDISVIPYQRIDGKKIFRVDMLEIYKSPNYYFNGQKELYLRYSGDIKIIAEK